jgi:hypothetical protein
MPRSISYTDNLRQGTDKMNEIFGIESGALTDPYALTFTIYHRIRTLLVDDDIELTLGGSPVSNTFETLTVTGDGTHILTFPEESYHDP